MQTSIATVSVSGTLESKLRAIAQAGFHGVEIFENDLLTATMSTREVRELLSYLGLACTMFQPFRDFEGMPDALRPRVFERIERKFDLMQELGTDLLLVCSNVSTAAIGDRSRIVADFRELGERAARRGLRVGYEALAWGRHVYDHREAWSIVHEVDHPAIGLILDSFHSLARAVPVESLREIDPARIFIVQLADAPVLQMDYLSWSRHFRNMPGQGELPLVDYVAALLERGYKGPLSRRIGIERGDRWAPRAELPLRSGRAPFGPAHSAAAVPTASPRPRRRIHRVRRERDRSRATRLAVYEPRIRGRGPPSPQGRDPLAAERHQLRDQQRAGEFRPRVRRHAWRIGLRARRER
jgi:sugar phosphate isomerase/epimerase